MKVLIGLPTVGALDPGWIVAYHALEKPLRPDGMPDWAEAFIVRQVIHLSRNMLAKAMLKMEAERFEWLFMLDDDVFPPPDALMRLLSHNERIVSGLYLGRRPPHQPVAYHFHTREDGSGYLPITAEEVTGEPKLIEVEAIGAGCLLVHRTVFEAMQEAEMTPFQFLCGGGRDGRDMSEDMWFCEQARTLGFRIMLDTGVSCGHAGRTIYRLGSTEVVP